MKTSQSFVFYPTDFLLGTALFSASEVGAYIRLLCYQWHEGSLPNDENLLTNLARSSLADVLAIMPKFQVGADGKLRNRRLEDVRKELIASRKRRSNAGKQGGRPKKALLSNSLSDVKTIQSSPSPSPSPSHISLELPLQDAKKEKIADPRFTIFRDIFAEEYNLATEAEWGMNGAKDGAQLSRFLKAFPNLEADQWRSGIRWSWDTAGKDAFAKGFLGKASDLSGFCAVWNQIVGYAATYIPPEQR